MSRDISAQIKSDYDLLVIGGGINGAAVANMASFNGLSVVLLEKGDFAGGTSSKSTKLVHGGLRYLENLEFGLVKESLRERSLQLKFAPHLVKPLTFVVPVYSTDRRPLWLMDLGVGLYDLLAGKHGMTRHRRLTAEEVARRIPDIDRTHLAGGVVYADAQMDDARLCLENILSARAQGADVFNYVQAVKFLKQGSRAVGVKARDVLTQRLFDVKAQRIVCCAGPWTDIVFQEDQKGAPRRIRMTKGVHVIYPGTVSADALMIPARKDKRIFFVIPWQGNSLIGTTDTDFHQSPDTVTVEDADIDYLLEELNRVFPEKKFESGKIITSFAGLRPLAHEPGHPSRVSRQHVTERSFSGVYYLYGGKYTTYRKMAEDVLRQAVSKKLRRTTQAYPLYGAGVLPRDLSSVTAAWNIPADVARLLVNRYGARYEDVLALVKENDAWREPVCSCSDAIGAQVIYSVRTEMAHTVEDVVRRLGLNYVACPSQNCRQTIAGLLSGFEKS